MLWSCFLLVIAFFAALFIFGAYKLSQFLPSLLKEHVEGLSAIIHTGLSIKIGRFSIERISIGIEGWRICLFIHGFNASLIISQGIYQEPGSPGLLAEHIKMVSLSSGVSWFVQIGSRFHPLWQLLNPWWKLIRPLQALLGSLKLAVVGCDVEVVVEDEDAKLASAPALLVHLHRVELKATPWSRSRSSSSTHAAAPASSVEGAVVAPPIEDGDKKNRPPSGFVFDIILLVGAENKEEDYLPLLLFRNGQRGHGPIPIVEVEGALGVSVELPWPPQIALASEHELHRGFEYLRRPPLLPQRVKLCLAKGLKVSVDESHVLLVSKAADFVLASSASSPSSEEPLASSLLSEENKEVDSGQTPLLKQYLGTFEADTRFWGIPDLLLGTEWTQFLIDCPCLQLGLRISSSSSSAAASKKPATKGGSVDDEEMHHVVVLRLENLSASTSKTLVEDNRLSTKYRVGLGGLVVEIKEDKRKELHRPVHIGPCDVELGVQLTYEDVVMSSSHLVPKLTLAYEVTSIIHCQSISLSWAAELSTFVFNMITNFQAMQLVSPSAMQQQKGPTLLVDGDDDKGSIPPTVACTICFNCPVIEARYGGRETFSKEKVDRLFAYSTHFAVQGVSLQTQPWGGEGTADVKIAATGLGLDMDMKEADVPEAEEAKAEVRTKVMHSCRLIEAQGIGVGIAVKPMMIPSESSENLSMSMSVSAVLGEEEEGALKPDVLISLTNLGIEWNPLIIVGLQCLIEPLLLPFGPPPHRSQHGPSASQVEEKHQPTSSPPTSQPLTLALAQGVMEGHLEDGFPAIQGEVSSVVVRFPYSLSYDLGEMTSTEVWGWLNSRQAVLSSAASSKENKEEDPNPASSKEETKEEWNEEIVRIRKTAFKADPAADPALPQWVFTISDCTVGHLASRPGEAAMENVYCHIKQFATRQNAHIIDICAHGVTMTWSPLQQIRVIKVSQDVTLSVWVSLLQIRRRLYDNENHLDFNVNAKLDDPVALSKLATSISSYAGAKGDVLNRFFVSDVKVDASLPTSEDGSREPLGVALEAGLVVSEDLPELWAFADIAISIQGQPTVLVSEARVRHTVDDRENVVFGEALQELRIRRLACAAASSIDQEVESRKLSWMAPILNGKEGQRIDLRGFTFRLGRRLPLQALLEIAPKQAMTTIKILRSLPSKWIPDHPNYARLFKRPTFRTHGGSLLPPPALCLWLRMEEVGVEIAENPLESWLEFVRPVWVQELTAQGIREEQMERQTEHILRTSGSTDVDYVRMSMAKRLQQLNSAYYLQAVNRTVPEGFRRHRPCILRALLGEMNVTVEGLDSPLKLMRELDENPIDDDSTVFDVLEAMQIKGKVQNLRTTVRWAQEPLLAIANVSFDGTVVIAQHASLPHLFVEEMVSIYPGQAALYRTSFVKPHLYTDLNLQTEGLQLTYVPGVESAFEEIIAFIVHLLPPPPILGLDPRERADPLSWWDELRHFFHGRVKLTCYGTHVSLLASEGALVHHQPASSLSDRGEQQQQPELERIAMECSVVVVSYTLSKVAVDVLGVVIHQMPSPPDIPPLLEVPSVRARIGLEWQYNGGTYRVHPLITSSSLHKKHTKERDGDDIYADYRSHGVRVYVQCQITPKDQSTATQAARSLCRIPQVEESILALADMTTVICYGKSLPWYSAWMMCFVRKMTAPRVYKRGRVLAPALQAFRRQIRSVETSSMEMEGLHILAYDSHPLDENRRGLRVSITGRLSTSITISEEAELPDPFATGKLLIPNWPRPFWSINNLSLEVSSLEARLCTPETGPKGEFLFSLGVLEYHQSNKLPSDLHPLEGAATEAVDGGGKGEEKEAREGRMRQGYHDMLALYAINDQTSSRHRNSLAAHAEGPKLVAPSPDGPFELSSLTSPSPMEGSSTEQARKVLNRDRSSSQTSLEGEGGGLDDPSTLSGGEGGSTTTTAADSKVVSVNQDAEALRFANMLEPFLHSVVVDGFKFLLTLETRNALLELVEAYLKIVLPFLPSPAMMTSSPPPPPTSPIKSQTSLTDSTSGATLVSPSTSIETPVSSSIGGSLSSTIPTPTSNEKRVSLCSPAIVDPTPSTSSKDRQANFAAKGRRTSLAETMINNLFSFEFNRIQIQLLDNQYKACVVFVMDYACIQGRVGIDGSITSVSAPTTSSSLLAAAAGAFVSKQDELDSNRLSPQEKRNMLLQRLAQREVKNYSESIVLNVNASMLFVAPTDVDIGVGLVWLPDAAFKGIARRTEDDNFSDLGLLRPILNPLPLELYILAVHDASLHHIIRIKILDIGFCFDDEHIQLLRKAGERVLMTPMSSLEERAKKAQSRRLRKHLVQNAVLKWREMSLEELGMERRSLLWTLRHLKETSLGIKGALNQPFSSVKGSTEAGTMAALALDEGPSSSHLEENFVTLSHFARDDLGIVVGGAETTGKDYREWMEAWVNDCEEGAAQADNEQQMLTEHVQAMLQDVKAKSAMKPNTQLDWRVHGLSIKLRQFQRPFCVAVVQSIQGSFSSFEDEASKLNIDVLLLKVDDLRSTSTTQLQPTPVVFPAVTKRPYRTGVGVMPQQAEWASQGQEHTFLHIQANLGSPVGGLTILRHFEINCCPLTVRLTRGLVVQFVEFLNLGAASESQMDKEHQASRAAFLASPTEIRHPKSKNSQLKRPSIPSPGPPVLASQDSGGSAGSSSSIRRPSASGNMVGNVPSAGSSHAPPNRRGSREAMFLFGDSGAGAGNAGGGEIPSKIIDAAGGSEKDGGGVGYSQMQDVAELKKRAQRNIVFKHFRLGEVNIFFSYSGAKWGNLEDVDHLHLKLHPIVYSNKTSSAKEFLIRLRKDVILDLLSQVNRNFANLGAFLQQSMTSWSHVTDDDGDGGGGNSDRRGGGGGIMSFASGDYASVVAAANQGIEGVVGPGQGLSSSLPSREYLPEGAESEGSSGGGSAPSRQHSSSLLFGARDSSNSVQDRKKLLFGPHDAVGGKKETAPALASLSSKLNKLMKK